MKRLFLAIAAGALLLGACGDDGGSSADLSGEEQQLADKISASLLADTQSTVPLTQKEADCIGAGLVSKIGVDRLSSIDFEETDVQFDLSEKEAGDAAGVMVDCVDLQASLAKSFAEDGTISESSAKCLAGKFDDDTLKGLFTDVFQGNDPEGSGAFLRIVTAGMTECLTDEELSTITGD